MNNIPLKQRKLYWKIIVEQRVVEVYLQAYCVFPGNLIKISVLQVFITRIVSSRPYITHTPKSKTAAL